MHARTVCTQSDAAYKWKASTISFVSSTSFFPSYSSYNVYGNLKNKHESEARHFLIKKPAASLKQSTGVHCHSVITSVPYRSVLDG
uniref:Ovule protein n=1 Tax=Steinernema glaseri TaxID=37863 RepID=A0A1I8AKQ2_9BILA